MELFQLLFTFQSRNTSEWFLDQNAKIYICNIAIKKKKNNNTTLLRVLTTELN